MKYIVLMLLRIQSEDVLLHKQISETYSYFEMKKVCSSTLDCNLKSAGDCFYIRRIGNIYIYRFSKENDGFFLRNREKGS